MDVCMKPDRLDPARTDGDVKQILALVVEVRAVWVDVVEGTGYPFRMESNGRGKGFEDIDPTYSAAMSPTQRYLRGTARHAASLISDARERLEDAAITLHNGLLKTDPEVMQEFLEKRAAAIGE